MELDWLWKSLFARVVWTILALAVAAMLGWAKKRQALWADPVRFGLGAFAIIIFGMIGVRLILIPSQVLPEQVTPENIEARLRAWCDTFHLGVQKLEDNPLWYFGYVVTNSYQRRSTVIRLKSLDRYLVIQARITLGTDYQKQLAALRPAEASRLIRDLQMELAKFRIGFSDVSLPLTMVTLQKTMPILTNVLTEASFLQAIDDLDSAEVFTLQAIPRELEEHIRPAGTTVTR